MRALLFFLFFSSISVFSYGQDQWLVTAKMDTIYGKIYLETGDQYKADEAKVKDGKKKISYKSYQIRSVHLGKNDDYETLKIDGRYQFVQVDIKGKYFSRYLYNDPDLGSSSNFALKILVNWKGEQYKTSNLTSKKRFAAYFEDCESVSQKIESGELKKKDFEKIIAEYDVCIDQIQSQITAMPITTQPVVPSSEMENLISELKSKDLYKGEMVTMLEDVNQRMSNNENIPNYLQQAVLAQLEGNEDLKAQFLAILGN